ncbi:MAG: RNB domain-containing ribonuclease [Thermoplasmatota archaeon]
MNHTSESVNMEIRELVRLKKGIGGLEPPLNFGIILSREKVGGNHLASVHTLKGKLTIKWKFLKESTGTIYQGSKGDEAAMTAFIREAVRKEERHNVLKTDPQQIIEKIDPRDLWNSIIRYIDDRREGFGSRYEGGPNGVHERIFSPEEIGRIHFEPNFLDPKQVWAVSRVLSRCDGGREPYFMKVDIDRKPNYLAYRKESISSVREHIDRLERLRSRYLEWAEEEIEGTERTRRVPRLRVDDISQVDLSGEERQEIDRICGWSVYYLENGRWPAEQEEVHVANMGPVSPFGLGGFSITRLDSFDLERFVEYFTMDSTRTARGAPASSLMAFLLKMERINWREASELVVRFNIASGAQKFHDRFPAHVQSTADRLPEEVLPADEEGRVDLTRLETYTIDPEDAKDFDDAVSLEKEGENTIVWVHIADVSHYVHPGDLIDAEARFRSTSVYLPTGVLPMLPEKLSENLCSLREGRKRLAVSTRMVLSSAHELLEWKHMQSVIEVDGNLSYGQVEGWIKEGREPFHSLMMISRGLEERGGRLNIETPERKITFTGDNEITVNVKRPTAATKLIEELMVLANECASNFLEKRGCPLPFRVHPLPDRISAAKFNSACEALSLDISIDTGWEESGEKRPDQGGEDAILSALLSGGKITFGNLRVPRKEEAGDHDAKVAGAPDPEVFQKAVSSYNRVLRSISGVPNGDVRDMLYLRLLRTMEQAFYSVENIGHFGLNSRSYCHFTSPIRRYPDILVHRAVKAVLAGEGSGPEVSWGIPETEEVEDILETVNDMSDSAESWERTMVDVALATRMEMTPSLRRSGHRGMVTSITPSSCFILLDDGVTEGRIPIREMSPYPLTVDENETKILHSLREGVPDEPRFLEAASRGEEEIELLKLGDRIGCSVNSISIVEGKIELRLRNG